MTKRRSAQGLDWLKVILVVAVLLAVFAGTEMIARQEAARPPVAPAVQTEIVIPGDGGAEERLALPPVPTVISRDQIRPVARSRSSR